MITLATAALATSQSIISINPTLQFVWFIIEIIGVIAFAIAYGRRGIAKNTIELQSEQIQAQKDRIDTLDKDLERVERARISDAKEYKSTIDRLETKTKDLEASIRVLENMKSGADAINMLGAQLIKMGEDNKVAITELKLALTGAS